MPERQRLAPAPPGAPIFGNLIAYRRDPAQFILQMQRDIGEISRMRMGPYTVNLVTEPAAVRRILVENHANYVRGKLYDQFKLVMGNGLLTTDGPQWRAHRRTVQPFFARKAVSGIGPNVVAAARNMLDTWEVNAAQGRPINLVDEMLRLTLVTLSTSLFGYDIENAVPELKKIVDSSIDVMFPHGYVSEMLPLWAPTPRNRMIRRNRRFLDDLIDKVRSHHAEAEQEPLLDAMEGAEDPVTGERWTDQEIRDEMLTIYLAGHETTAVALCWTLVTIANHKWAVEAVQEEIRDVLSGRDPVAEDFDKLTFTGMVINECLRLYPPIWLYPRDAVADDTLGDYDLPAGTSVLLSPLASHRNPEVWENPEAFDPERFAPGAEQQRPKLSYFPFGGGPRLCVGNHMALLELRMAVTMILQRFRLEVVPGNIKSFGASVISLRPLNDPLVRIRPRQDR